MFKSLRWRLIGSYVLVIFVCLTLAGGAVVLVLRDYQQRARLDALGYQSVFISFQVDWLEGEGASFLQLSWFLRRLSDNTGIRIILTDQKGVVLADTSKELDGERIPLPSRQGTQRRGGYYALTDRGLFLIAPAPESSKYVVILAVPQADVAQAWLELLPNLAVAAAVSLVVSVLLALFLTRSIARPLVQMTRASEEMARGRYDQSIPVRGRDEVGRLAAAFNDMAQQVAASDRTMRDFLANVSHELKTPLTSIQGFSQAMLDGTVVGAEEHQRAAGIINHEANRMRGLVEDLLTLSKIESGQIAMGDDPVDLDRLLREAARQAEWLAEASNVQVAVDSRPGALVRGDAHWLAQVFSNLLGNALHHTPPGGRVAVRAQARAEPSEVTVAVHNTGSYIPPEDLPRVFERFFQVDRSRSPLAGGSGLGLAIVREIVQAHGGSVDAASDPVSGTTFSVRLPLHSLQEPAPLPFPTTRVA
ncbi:MAG TPA: HAMP domain-containing sensor histidine kinase [Chloroflexota bacterium]|jgi:signal transduction histidine kinase|nr:HAMP domain-containing sensor histidine kinase [Chloroflexota bacterium]